MKGPEFVLVLLQLCLGVPLLKKMTGWFRKRRFVCANYKGEKIPCGLGLYVWTLASFALFGQIVFAAGGLERGTVPMEPVRHWFALSGVFLLGWLDDRFGHRQTVKGIRGHLAALWRDKRLTTGMLKLAGIPVIAAWFAGQTAPQAVLWALNTAILCTSANVVNLLDLRPGRAIKGYLLLLAFSLLFAGMGDQVWRYLLPVLVPALILFPADLRGKVMLGDAGSNLLGFSAGVCLILTVPPPFLAGLLYVFLTVHWIAERDSLSRIIDRHRFLRFLDRFGRANTAEE